MISLCNCSGFNFYEKSRIRRRDTCNWRKGTGPNLRAPFQNMWRKDGISSMRKDVSLWKYSRRTINEGWREHHKIIALQGSILNVIQSFICPWAELHLNEKSKGYYLSSS